MDFLNWIKDHPLEILGVLWAAHRVADLVAHLTPTEKDDALVAKFGRMLDRIASLGLKPKA